MISQSSRGRLPAPFENTYYMERTLKVAARQKQAQILVSGAKPDNGQGLPLPHIHDVPALRRGSYPYDYECEWGRFKNEYELGSYLFSPHDGRKAAAAALQNAIDQQV